MSKFNKISKDSANFGTAEKVFSDAVARFDYDGMASAYNETEVGGYLSFEFKRGKSAIVSNQLTKRGLTRGDDFEVRCVANSEAGEDAATVIIHRLSETETGELERAPRGRRKAG